MEDKKPKIALCLSGLIRNSYFCFPYIYDSFLNQGLDVDVFIHTWNESPTIRLYNPHTYQIENQTEILKNIKSQLKLDSSVAIEGNVDNNISMYYSIKKCFDLVPPDYEFVIRCRFDLLLQDKIDLVSILNGIRQNEYDIFIPGEIFNVGGYNDQLAIGSYQAMKYYSDCILYLNDIIAKLKRWHPESFLGEWLASSTPLIRIKQDNYDYRIVRSVTPQLSWKTNPFNFKNI